jgi:hypothetical protein
VSTFVRFDAKTFLRFLSLKKEIPQKQIPNAT